MKRSIIRIILCINCTILLFSAGCGRGCARAPKSAAALLEQVEEVRLDNGMVWLLLKRGTAPVFTGVVQIRVGGIEEPPGKGGLAHMFEHMAFKGSGGIGVKDAEAEAKLLDQIRAVDQEIAAKQAVGDTLAVVGLEAKRTTLGQLAQKLVVPNEVWHLFHTNGAAELNAYTSKDVTAYYARMPAGAMPLWVYLTSQMVGHPVMREFYSERNVVMEERRSSVDNSPRGQLYEALMRTAFSTSPYRFMTIGSMDHLRSLTIAEAEKFHGTYYRPNRMVGAIVGNFDIAQAKATIQRFFGSLPAKPAPETSVAPEPPQTKERRVEVEYDAGARVFIAYHKPTLPHYDDYVFDALQHILCGGESGRLIKRLEKELRIASGVGCWNGSPGSRLANLFIIMAQPLNGHTPEAIVAAVEAELTLVREAQVRDDELVTARTNLRASFLWGLNSNEDLAQSLAHFQTLADDWRYIVTHQDVMAKISLDDIHTVARNYLAPAKRTVAILRRPK